MTSRKVLDTNKLVSQLRTEVNAIARPFTEAGNKVHLLMTSRKVLDTNSPQLSIQTRRTIQILYNALTHDIQKSTGH